LRAAHTIIHVSFMLKHEIIYRKQLLIDTTHGSSTLEKCQKMMIKDVKEDFVKSYSFDGGKSNFSGGI